MVFDLFSISPTKIPSSITNIHGDYSNIVYKVCGIHEHLVGVERQLQAPDVIALD